MNNNYHQLTLLCIHVYPPYLLVLNPPSLLRLTSTTTPPPQYMEAPLLQRSRGNLDELIGGDGDYLPVRGLKPWWSVFCIESLKLWTIGGPIAFQILCHYAINSVATMFVGHLGDVELSAFSVAISVVGTFAFGIMVSRFHFIT